MSDSKLGNDCIATTTAAINASNPLAPIKAPILRNRTNQIFALLRLAMLFLVRAKFTPPGIRIIQLRHKPILIERELNDPDMDYLGLKSIDALLMQ